VTPALLLALVLGVAAPAPKDAPKAPAAESPLLGEWVVESHVASGKLLRPIGKPERVKITKDRWIVVKDGESDANLTLDPTKDPPHIDVWVPVQGDEMDANARGIYKLEGDTLTVSYRLGGERATKFESQPKSGVYLMTLKRVKAPK
jgi:uncharacterized protein (TIGR03067 family)